MTYDDYDILEPEDEGRPPDLIEERARAELVEFLEARRQGVFSRQLEVQRVGLTETYHSSNCP